MFANSVLRGHHLASLYEKQGNKEEAELFTYLAGKAEQDVRDDECRPLNYGGTSIKARVATPIFLVFPESPCSSVPASSWSVRSSKLPELLPPAK